DPGTGELRMGTGQAMAEILVSRVVDRLSRKYPRVVFHIVAGERAILMNELRQRNVELVITRFDEPGTEEDIQTEMLHQDTFTVVAGARSSWVRGHQTDLAALVGAPWTLPLPESWSGRLIEKAFGDAGLAMPKATAFTFSQPLRTELAATGRYLTVLPD